ncbi:MAG: amidohydrolase [Candidatus Heimdallarchaeota archaeon]|nr:MAG: amidohydrolase [Candidatus Heimdallarchaeota archaeon]
MDLVTPVHREIIDTHVHPIQSLTSAESLIREMDKAKVSKAVLLALDLDPNVLDTNQSLRDEIIYDFLSYSLFLDPYRLLDTMKAILRVGNTTNVHVADIVKGHPDRFLGFGSVNPSKNGNYVKEKLQEIFDLSLKGIKLIPTLQFFDPKRNKNLKSIFKFAYRQDWPILIHLGRDPGPWEIHTLRCVEKGHPKFWNKVVKKFSKNKIIFAHLGGYGEINDETWLNEVLRLSKKNTNIFLDTSAVPYQLEDPTVVESIRKTCGFERILFGTDTPVVLGTSMAHSKQIIEKNSILTQEEKSLIFSENAKKLFNL